MAKIHNRMPVFLSRDDWDSWLNPDFTNQNELKALIDKREDDQKLQFWPVRPLVNSIRNNGAELIEPIEAGEPETLF